MKSWHSLNIHWMHKCNPFIDKSDLNNEHKISICCNGGWLRLSGLVKHDDSDTAQRSSQVHALIKYAARQVSSILTSLDAFTLDFFYFSAITQLQLYRHCNYRPIACSQISWQGDRVIALQESNGNHGFILVLQNGCVQKKNTVARHSNKA